MRHSSFLILAVSVSLFAASAGCSNDDGTEDPGSSSGAATSSSSGGSSGAVSQNDGGSSSGTVAAGTLTVTLAGTSYPVVLADLETTTFKDVTVVALPTVWKATGIKAEFTAYNFDFVGADGFRPSSRPNCKDVVFDGAATFAKGYVEIESRKLTWEDDLGFSGCAFVNDLATIEATSP